MFNPSKWLLIGVLIILAIEMIGVGFYTCRKLTLIENEFKEEIKEIREKIKILRGEINQVKKGVSGKAGEASEINTSNWKTYSNKKYGFEVKYPKEGKVTWEEEENGFLRVHIFLFRTPYTKPEQMYDNPYEIEKFFEIVTGNISQKSRVLGAGFTNKIGTVRFRDIEFIKEYGTTGGTQTTNEITIFYTTKGDRFYALAFVFSHHKYAVPGKHFNREKETEIFDQIVSTFRFSE